MVTDILFVVITIFSSFMTYHQIIFYKSNTTDYPSVGPMFAPGFSGACVVHVVQLHVSMTSA